MTLHELESATRGVKLSDLGDLVEQSSYRVLVADFPQYECFWRVFVFPYRLKGSIRLNPELPRSQEAVCIYNYSVMRTVVRLHEYWRLASLKKDLHGDTTSQVFEDFYIRLAIAYEQVKQFLCSTYCAFEARQDRNDVTVKAWTQKRIKEPAWEWIGSDLTDRLEKVLEDTERYRNHIVHGPKWPGFRDRVPVPAKVGDLIYWSDWAREIQKRPEEWKTRTTDRLTVIEASRDEFIDLINKLWNEVTRKLLDKHGLSIPRSPDMVFFLEDLTKAGQQVPVFSSETVTSSSDYNHISIVRSDGTSVI